MSSFEWLHVRSIYPLTVWFYARIYYGVVDALDKKYQMEWNEMRK